MKENTNLLLKIKGALYGVALGDALGAPLEFMTEEQIRSQYGRVTEMIGGGWLDVSPGEVTDDTQMTIAVADGILSRSDNPLPYIGRNFVRWINSGPKDVGNTCRVAISMAHRRGACTREEWMRVGRDTNDIMHGKTAGNGALMRTIYPILYYTGAQQRQMVADIGKMTHYNEESTTSCLLYAGLVEKALKGVSLSIRRNKEKHNPTGYVIDSYFCALDAVASTNTFEEAIIAAVNRGGDADTIGAIAGGLAGAIYGYDQIPPRWIGKLDPEIRCKLDYYAESAEENRRGNNDQNSFRNPSGGNRL
jgi:ADP-ribosyl-(dinitrogen reductase) hydrolase|nr:MAG TPA: hypothetical protein [Caudoviricetes sp.]